MMQLETAHKLATALASLRPAAPAITIYPLTPDGRSWVLHAKQWWPVGSTLESMWCARPVEPTSGRIMGRVVDFPRRTRAYGCDYTYTGQTQRAAPIDHAPLFVQEVFSALQGVDTLQGHNAALLNWYDADLNEYMGPHSDDERDLVPLAPVVSLSWCSPGHFRRFRFTPRQGVGDALLPTWDGNAKMPGVINMFDGCLVIMGGQCQLTHKHELMKVRSKEVHEKSGRRINLTMRAFRKQKSDSSLSATDRRHGKRERDEDAQVTSKSPI